MKSQRLYKRSYVQLSSLVQKEGLMGGFKEWVDGRVAEWVGRWI
jgi:hypothetical protein